jgi:hypothetical protein
VTGGQWDEQFGGPDYTRHDAAKNRAFGSPFEHIARIRYRKCQPGMRWLGEPRCEHAGHRSHDSSGPNGAHNPLTPGTLLAFRIPEWFGQ